MGSIENIAGVYFNRENVFNSTAFRLFTDIDVNNDGVLNHLDCEAGIALGLIGCQVRNSFDQVKDSKAFYTDLSFAASQHFTLRGGLRYTHDKGEQSNLRSNILGTDEVFIANLIPGPAPVTALGAGCSATATGTVDCRFSKGEVNVNGKHVRTIAMTPVRGTALLSAPLFAGTNVRPVARPPFLPSPSMNAAADSVPKASSPVTTR